MRNMTALLWVGIEIDDSIPAPEHLSSLDDEKVEGREAMALFTQRAYKRRRRLVCAVTNGNLCSSL